MFHRISHDQKITEWIRQIVSEVKNHVHDNDIVYKKRLTKSPRNYVKLVPPHVKAALLLKEKGELQIMSGCIMCILLFSFYKQSIFILNYIL